MQRRTYVASIGSTLAAGLAGCSALGSNDDDSDGSDDSGGDGDNGSDPGNGNDGSDDGDSGDGTLTNASFENDLDGWTVGKDLPEEPGESEDVVDHGVETVTRQASTGESSVELFISGVADDGTIWVEQEVDFSDVAAVEIDAYSQEQSFNEIAKLAFFAGEKPADGLVEEDFDTDEHVEDHEGWKTYSYDVSDRSGTATLAVGMSVIWETEVRRMLDNVTLVTE